MDSPWESAGFRKHQSPDRPVHFRAAISASGDAPMRCAMMCEVVPQASVD